MDEVEAHALRPAQKAEADCEKGRHHEGHVALHREITEKVERIDGRAYAVSKKVATINVKPDTAAISRITATAWCIISSPYVH